MSAASPLRCPCELLTSRFKLVGVIFQTQIIFLLEMIFVFSSKTNFHSWARGHIYLKVPSGLLPGRSASQTSQFKRHSHLTCILGNRGRNASFASWASFWEGFASPHTVSCYVFAPVAEWISRDSQWSCASCL